MKKQKKNKQQKNKQRKIKIQKLNSAIKMIAIKDKRDLNKAFKDYYIF